jgi:hypothetical protein
VGGRDPRSRYGSLTAPSPWQRYTLQGGVGPAVQEEMKWAPLARRSNGDRTGSDWASRTEPMITETGHSAILRYSTPYLYCWSAVLRHDTEAYMNFFNHSIDTFKHDEHFR